MSQFDEDIHPLDVDLSFPYQKVNAPNLVKFLFLIAENKGSKMPREFRTYLREAKKFIDQVGEQQAIGLVQEAIRYSEHPFAFKFLWRLYESKTQVEQR